MPLGEKTKKLWENDEYRKMMSNAHKGKKASAETKLKMSKASKKRKRNGRIKVLCAICLTEFEKYRSQHRVKYCSKECGYKAMSDKMLGNTFAKGYTMSDENKKKASERMKKICGKNHPLWKGGSRREHKYLYGTRMYKEWRTAVFTRDDWTCKECNARSKKGLQVRLEAHHVLPWCDYEDLRFCIDNGLTLCKKCHDKTKKGASTSNKKRVG